MTEKIDINHRLQQLREVFADSLPEKLANIDTLWDSVKQQKFINNADNQDLCRAVHTLAGSAGTFGQAQLGEIAQHLEQDLRKVLTCGCSAIDAIENKLLALKESALHSQAFADDSDTLCYRDTPSIDVALLEDDPVLAKEIAEQLAIYDYRVSCCSNLDELETIFAEQSCAAILADVELSEGSLTSPELAARLTRLCQHDKVIIFISNRDDWEARLAAVRIGAIGYFKKPVDCGVIANCLSTIINPEQQEKKRVLIVEDQQELAQHYAEVLRQTDMLVEILESPAEVIHAIANFHPDLILMDLYMPICTGLELTSIIRQIEAYQGIPIVFLSVEPLKEKQHNAMFLGGDDFLQKPISNSDLVYAVSHRVDRFKSLNALMMRDSLTGLLNHATLKTQLETLQAQAQREATNLCFVMIDIDLFKHINDCYGHPRGDIVIRSLANLLKKRLRTSDVVGRYGGEEFAVILPNTEVSVAFAVIDELRHNFKKIIHYHQGKVFNASFSAGIACTPHSVSMQDLIDHADQALYQAKIQGRNQVVLAG